MDMSVEYCAPSGLYENFDVTPTQGVALGWVIAAPSGRNRKKRNTKTRKRRTPNLPMRSEPDAQAKDAQSTDQIKA